MVPTTSTMVPTVSPTMLSQSTVFPTPLLPPVAEASLCPARVDVSCASILDGTECMDIPVPEDKTSPDCIAQVEYTYNMTNFGTEFLWRVFDMTVLRNNTLIIVTNIPDAIPVVILAPGESYIAKSPSIVELNVCREQGNAIFNAKVDLYSGPPNRHDVSKRIKLGMALFASKLSQMLLISKLQ